MTPILVLNSGSSSLKYQLCAPDAPGGNEVFATGVIERVGQHGGPPNHQAAFAEMRGEAELAFGAHFPIAVGHRVVQGGTKYSSPTLVTPEVKAEISQLATLAPLHNPANLAGIVASERLFPGLPNVAVFDTAFHQSLAPEAWRYAIDRDLADRYGVRRFGFHGTSYQYVSRRTAELLDRSPNSLKLVILHLGNGASACAVSGGESVATSMGMTPLEGLVMGTRSGDIDPASLFHLHRSAGLDFDELETLLNTRSGLLGLSGSADMRDVEAAAAAGDAHARETIAIAARRIRFYIGAYAALLGELHAIVFTAGIGEHSPTIRREALRGLDAEAGFGVRLDEGANWAARGETVISAADSRVRVLVVPTNEELEIATQTLACAVR